MEYPRLVFKSPGPFKCNGGTYGHVPVENDAEYEAALKAGYAPTVPEALAAAQKPKAITADMEAKPAPEPVADVKQKAAEKPEKPKAKK